ncbi:N-6 DNA methylase [Chitinophaga sp. MM2321]|uniref:N-6 DNA methylase n=1 Tax=Chitinophaga sp. MM2321 TaxID=3137178 RepID=UPI0032D577B4
MDLLGRYYTAELFSELLVNTFSTKEPTSILELGVGGGSLIKAALSRWANASYYVADVDHNSLEKIKEELPFINTFHIDTIKENVSEKLNLKNGSVDIAICNPPYLKVRNELCYDSLFHDANLDACRKLRILTSDIIFLAKNLQLVKANGEIGIILPDSLITGKEFENFRAALIQEYHIKGIIQLPENIFPKTEALTHILYIEKQKPLKPNTTLFLSDNKGTIINSIDVDHASLVDRMDFKFHSWQASFKRCKRQTLALRDLSADVQRGSLTHKELKNSGKSYVHTTNMVHMEKCLRLKSSKIIEGKFRLTQKGDILLSRVGNIGKVSMVTQGKALYSDCIYRIRVAPEHRDQVWNALISEVGQSWLQAISHGVCAKVISKNDILNFPINV